MGGRVANLGKASMRWCHWNRGLNKVRAHAKCSESIPDLGKSNGEFLG